MHAYKMYTHTHRVTIYVSHRCMCMCLFVCMRSNVVCTIFIYVLHVFDADGDVDDAEVSFTNPNVTPQICTIRYSY